MNTLTRGSVNPSGKQKAFFASIPSDLAYLSDTAKHIFQSSNIAIYYDEDGQTERIPDETILDMNFVIVLLTEQTFNTDNDITNRVIPISIKNRIPILPIGITKEVGPKMTGYCEQMGIQSLDVLFPNSEDDTEIGFKTKLENWLKSKLVTGDKSQRIMSNFLISAFISYRKKDRRILLDIIDSINRKEKCREVQIWFDEFLTPGEGYDEEIQKMIDDSSIFIFLLTEHMIEEDNYALREELERAIETEKEIIVVDLIEGEHNLPSRLQEYSKYTIVKGDQGFDDLVELVEKCVPDTSGYSLEEAREHRYLLGMAYYYGIGVIADKEYGLRSIKEAAEAGCGDALDTMVAISVEEYGNFESAIYYQQKIVDMNDHRAMETKKLEDVEKCLRSMTVLGDYYFENQDVLSHEEIYKNIIAAIRGITNHSEYAGLLEIANMACIKLGDMADLRIEKTEASDDRVNYLNQARYWYESAFEYGEKFAGFEESLKSKRMIYAPRIRIADEEYNWTNKPFEEVIEDYLKTLEMVAEADRDYSCEETRADLAACHKPLMEIYNTVGNREKALEHGEKLLEYARQGYLETRRFHRLIKYMEALELVSKLQYECGLKEEARLNLNKGIKARMSYLESPFFVGREGSRRTGAVQLVADMYHAAIIAEELNRDQEAKEHRINISTIVDYYNLAPLLEKMGLGDL